MRTQRGLVSSIPNEVEDQEQAKTQAKEACQKAQTGKNTIKEQLSHINTEEAAIKTALAECTKLLQEINNKKNSPLIYSKLPTAAPASQPIAQESPKVDTPRQQ